MTKYVYKRLKDIPDDVFEKISKQLYAYSVGLIIVDNLTSEMMQIGSGIFVEINNKKGILSAKHVTNKITEHKDKNLGLLLYENILT